MDTALNAYSVTVKADISHQYFPGTWYVIHRVLSSAGAFESMNESSFVIGDACSQVQVKSLTTINGVVMSNYAHVPASVVPYGYSTFGVETEYLTEMVLTLNPVYPDIFDHETEYTWSSSSPSSIPNWPCPATVPYLLTTEVKPDATNLVTSSPSQSVTLTPTSISDLTAAPKFRIDTAPAIGVQLYSI